MYHIATPVVVSLIHAPAVVVHMKVKVNGLAHHLQNFTICVKLTNGNATITIHKLAHKPHHDSQPVTNYKSSPWRFCNRIKQHRLPCSTQSHVTYVGPQSSRSCTSRHLRWRCRCCCKIVSSTSSPGWTNGVRLQACRIAKCFEW